MTTKAFTLTMPLPFTCPGCGEACGHLFEASGVCLGCEIDWQDTTVLEYESREVDEFWTERCEVGGID